MKRFKTSQHTNREDQLIYAGLVGVGIAAVLTTLSIDVLDLPLCITAYTFAISLPLLALSIVAISLKQRYKYTVIPWYIDFANFAGTICAAIGIAALFWHFSWAIGALFTLFGAFTFIAIFLFHESLKQANKKDEAQQAAPGDADKPRA